jgi:hypothetical protein
METSEPANKRASYEDFYGIPEDMIGEIIGGELAATPDRQDQKAAPLRPAWRDALLAD